MNYKQLLSRLNGLSIWGASWEAKPAETDIVQRVITFLEDRRVLFNDYELEVPRDCVESVLEIRRFLTEVLQTLPNKTGLPQHLRVMRGACKHFLDRIQAGVGDGDEVSFDRALRGEAARWKFFTALGELRSIIGLHLGIIAAKHKLGIEGDLATILPPPADDD